MLKIIVAILLMSVSPLSDLLPKQVSTPIEKNSFFKKSLPFNDHYEETILSSEEQDKRLSVNYELKETDIYVECYVKQFTFTRDNLGSVKKDGEGHIHLYINESKVDSLFQPSFIIKSLPNGNYKIRLELIHNDDTPYGINEEFEVTL